LEELVSDKIMKPENAIFMTNAEHQRFGQFEFYLDKDAVSSTISQTAYDENDGLPPYPKCSIVIPPDKRLIDGW